MTDRKISRKPTLTWRILTVALLLLVIPLLFQTFFLYDQEYEQKKADVERDLELLVGERAILIEQKIRRDWEILNALGTDSERGAKELQIETIPLPNGVPDQFAIASRALNLLLVGIKRSPYEAYVFSIPYASLLEKHAGPYPIRLSLVNQKGKLIAENRAIWTEKDLLEVQQPISGTDLILALTIPEEVIEGLHQRDYIYRFATLLFFVGVFGGGAVYLLTRRVEKPLAQLCKTMERVSEGAIHTRYQPDRMGFEINALGLQFNQTLDALLESTEAVEKERRERSKLAEKWRIGHEIQASLFPVSIPGFPHTEIGRGYLPAQEVNGDYYDLFPLENGQLLIAICDTAGKGISACLFSLGLRSIIRSMATTTSDLAEIVQKANDLFWIDARESSMFATLWIALYDPKTHLLTYCSQGHPPALLKRGKAVIELTTGGIAIGAQKMDTVAVQQMRLESEDLLVLYTDGIIEAHNTQKELYGQKRLHEFLVKEKFHSCQSAADSLLQDVKHFSNGAHQHDDITLLLLRPKY